MKNLPEIQTGFPQNVVEAHVLHDIPIIRAWREYLGFSEEEVAVRAGMKQPSLARIERGDRTLRKTTLLKIAKAMGISVEQLTV